MTKISKKLFARLAVLSVATVGLSGCVYDMGLGYYDDGYASNSYDCDPYAPFNSYYACDSGYGFYNIGFGGGWYDNYWYPGYGYYIFDNGGRRYNMQDRYRRYWGEQRHQWYRNHHGREDGYRDGRGRDDDRRGHGNGYRDGSRGTDQPIGWPESHGGRRDERSGRPPQPAPPPGDAVGRDDWEGRGGNRDGRREGRRGNRDGWRNGNAPVPGADAVPQPQPQAQPQPEGRPRGDNPGRGGGNGNGGGGGRWQPPSGGSAPQPDPGSYTPPQRSDRKSVV